MLAIATVQLQANVVTCHLFLWEFSKQIRMNRKQEWSQSNCSFTDSQKTTNDLMEDIHSQLLWVTVRTHTYKSNKHSCR